MDEKDLQNMSAEEILELQKKNCIFCKIISKEIPSHVIYSDEKALVILDINPSNEGHCLILPVEHFQILPQIPDETIAHLFRVAKKISRSLLKALSVKGTSIFVANGAIAGQKAPHFMIHCIPRKPGDLLFNLPKNNLDENELNEVHKKLGTKLGYIKTDIKQIPHQPVDSKVEPSIEEKNVVKPVESSDKNMDDEIKSLEKELGGDDEVKKEVKNNASFREDVAIGEELKEGFKEPNKKINQDTNNEMDVKNEESNTSKEVEKSQTKQEDELGKKEASIDDIANLFLGK